jgi:hypothetical protein
MSCPRDVATPGHILLALNGDASLVLTRQVKEPAGVAVTQDDLLYRFRLRTFTLAAELEQPLAATAATIPSMESLQQSAGARSP